MQDTEFFANIRYANILQLMWLIIDTNMYVYFFPHTKMQRSSSLLCGGIYIQYYYAYYVDPLANAGIKHKA